MLRRDDLKFQRGIRIVLRVHKVGKSRLVRRYPRTLRYAWVRSLSGEVPVGTLSAVIHLQDSLCISYSAIRQSLYLSMALLVPLRFSLKLDEIIFPTKV